MNLLLEISRCPIAQEIIKASSSEERPCWKIVKSQNIKAIDDFQLPEPWSGQIQKAPILFLSSNPSISSSEIYPRWSWSDEMIIDYFMNRFGNGKRQWIKDGKYCLQEDKSYSRAVSFWASVRKRTEELFERGVEPGLDYALSEIVHCKSEDEFGVKDAMEFCSKRYLSRILAVSKASIIVVLGRKAEEMIRKIYAISVAESPVAKPIEISGHERNIVFLPHPNARKKRTFKSVLSELELSNLQEVLKSIERTNPASS